jgi:hypothetical protein
MAEINLKQIIKADFYEKLIIKLNTPGLDHKTAFFRLLAVSQKAGLGLRDSLQSIFRSEKHG